MVQALLAALSACGLYTWRWLYTSSWPERYVRPRVPAFSDGPVTLSSDHRGLI